MNKMSSTIRLIDLLDLIARYGKVKSKSNFQKLPKKIKLYYMKFHLVYNVDNDYTIVYEADDDTKRSYNVGDLFESLANYRYEETLNEEIEILEEDDYWLNHHKNASLVEV